MNAPPTPYAARLGPIVSTLIFAACVTLVAQSADSQEPGGRPPRPDGPPSFGPVDFPPDGPPPGGPGMQEELKLVAQFDKDGDKHLNPEERKAARSFAQQNNQGRRPRGPGGRGRPPGGPGGFGPRAETAEPPKPGPRITPSEACSYPGEALFSTNSIRTFFLQFDNADWEKELSDFHNTDVEVPATLTVDGATLKDVGVHFRGASSYGMVGEGQKRSFNLSLDDRHKEQNLQGFRTLNLLNSHEDPSFLRTVLYQQAARDYLPAAQANWVRLVINGESWGVFENVEQFNKDFIKQWFGTTKGNRWKVPGSPQGRGSLAYLGDDPEAYRKIYSLKCKETPQAWTDLIRFTTVLNETPSNLLVKALSPLLNIEGALRFLALENALINNDGYWIRTSDYALYEDVNGQFHVVPHDTNETFAKPGGPGFGGGPRRRPGGGGPEGGPDGGPRPPKEEDQTRTERPGPPPGPDGFPGFPGGPRGGDRRGPRGGLRINGVELDPLLAANDPSKPLLSKLLAVPELRTRYLQLIREISDKWLDWEKLGPIAEKYHKLVAAEVAADTRKLDSTEDFEKSLTEDIAGKGGGPGGNGTMALKNFADQRRAYLKRILPEASR